MLSRVWSWGGFHRLFLWFSWPFLEISILLSRQRTQSLSHLLKAALNKLREPIIPPPLWSAATGQLRRWHFGEEIGYLRIAHSEQVGLLAHYHINSASFLTPSFESQTAFFDKKNFWVQACNLWDQRFSYSGIMYNRMIHDQLFQGTGYFSFSAPTCTWFVYAMFWDLGLL